MPAVYGGKADIYDGILYADNGSETPVFYSGGALTLDDWKGNDHYHGDVMVSHVTEDTKNLFVLTPDITKFFLVYDSA